MWAVLSADGGDPTNPLTGQEDIYFVGCHGDLAATSLFSHRTIPSIGNCGRPMDGRFTGYDSITYRDGPGEWPDIAAGQARLFSVMRLPGNRGGDIRITWTPDLPRCVSRRTLTRVSKYS